MKRTILLVVGLFVSITSLAQPTSCPEHFANGEAPEFLNPKLTERTASLCFEAYAVMHSGVSRTPLWSAEHLDKNRIDDAKTIKRRNTFHPEEQLAARDRAELRDYARSGFDRGHMSPSGDMPTQSAQHESFSLVNIIPQNPKNNQNVWANIEEKIRDLAERRELYVITGPMFEGSSIERINGRVLVPTHVYKAVYDPKRQQAGAYITANKEGSEYETVSIAELEKRININLFPQLSNEVKQKAMKLPEPTERKPRSQRGPDEQDMLRRILKSFGIT